MARLHSCIRTPINTHPGFSGRNANQTFHGIVSSTKIIKLSAIKGKEKSPWSGSYQFANHPEEEAESQIYEK
jgi:hypothetical protein